MARLVQALRILIVFILTRAGIWRDINTRSWDHEKYSSLARFGRGDTRPVRKCKSQRIPRQFQQPYGGRADCGRLGREGSGQDSPQTAATPRRIPIGVFDTVYFHLSLDEMLDKISALGLEAVEISMGGYGAPKHIPVDDILADPAKAKAWKKKFEDRNIRLGALNSSGNPIHPNPRIARRYDADFRQGHSPGRTPGDSRGG